MLPLLSSNIGIKLEGIFIYENILRTRLLFSICLMSQCDIARTARSYSPISPNLHVEALPHAYPGDDAVPGGGEGGGPRMSVRSCRRILVHDSPPFLASIFWITMVQSNTINSMWLNPIIASSQEVGGFSFASPVMVDGWVAMVAMVAHRAPGSCGVWYARRTRASSSLSLRLCCRIIRRLGSGGSGGVLVDNRENGRNPQFIRGAGTHFNGTSSYFITFWG